MSEEPVENKKVEEGAPAWVVTFGDLMSLLLCFFVLLLSFSEMDRAKYKEVAGSLRKAFGVQRQSKAFQTPKGLKMIAKDFDQQIIPALERLEYIATQERKEVEEELRKEIETNFQDIKDMIQVKVGDKELTIRLMGETAFDSGKAEIKNQMAPLLKKIGLALKGKKGDIVVAGHTDDRPIRGGLFKSNLQLSSARAASVADFFMNKIFIKPERIATMGFGKYKPIGLNATEKGRRRNRRVEIILKAPQIKKSTTR